MVKEKERYAAYHVIEMTYHEVGEILVLNAILDIIVYQVSTVYYRYICNVLYSIHEELVKMGCLKRFSQVENDPCPARSTDWYYMPMGFPDMAELYNMIGLVSLTCRFNCANILRIDGI